MTLLQSKSEQKFRMHACPVHTTWQAIRPESPLHEVHNLPCALLINSSLNLICYQRRSQSDIVSQRVQSNFNCVLKLKRLNYSEILPCVDVSSIWCGPHSDQRKASTCEVRQAAVFTGDDVRKAGRLQQLQFCNIF